MGTHRGEDVGGGLDARVLEAEVMEVDVLELDGLEVEELEVVGLKEVVLASRGCTGSVGAGGGML